MDGFVDEWEEISPSSVVIRKYMHTFDTASSPFTNDELLFLTSKSLIEDPKKEFAINGGIMPFDQMVSLATRRDLLFILGSKYRIYGCICSRDTCIISPEHYTWQCDNVRKQHQLAECEKILANPQDIFYTAKFRDEFHGNKITRVFRTSSLRDEYVGTYIRQHDDGVVYHTVNDIQRSDIFPSNSRIFAYN